MRAVVMDEFGGPEVLRYRQVADPVAGPGQVLVAVEYASITFVETQVRAGRGPAALNRPTLPRVPGNGVGGRIVAVGPDVDPALVGTTVVTTTGGEGGYAELALARVEDTVPVPAGLALRDATALLADGRTALWLHRRAQVQPGEWVLVEAAGGGVGSLLVQLMVDSGARVIGAAGGPGKSELVASLGAVGYVDYSTPGWSGQVVEITGCAGLDLVLDGVGGDVVVEAVTALRDGGRVLNYGMASGLWSALEAPDLAARSITIVGGAPLTPAEAQALSSEALALAAAGRLRPTIGQILPLAEAAAAHAAIEARATTGKTLLVPDRSAGRSAH
ncbi:zinc-binding dehydrogenase [Micromonospora sp. NPDC003197]